MHSKNLIIPLAMTIGALPFCANSILLFITLPIVWGPYRSIKNDKPLTLKACIVVLSILPVFLLVLLWMQPHDWYKFEPKEPKVTTQMIEDNYLIYNNIVNDLTELDVTNVSIWSYIKGEAIDYVIDEDMLDQIIVVLKQAPVKYYYHPVREPQPTSRTYLNIHIFYEDEHRSSDVSFTYDFDYLDNTFIWIYSSNKNTYFTVSDSYIDQVLQILSNPSNQ